MSCATVCRMTQHSAGTPRRAVTTTNAGIAVASQEHSLTVCPDGPILLQDSYLVEQMAVEQMANVNWERIPERPPHAKGGGAFGRLVVTGDVHDDTKTTEADDHLASRS